MLFKALERDKGPEVRRTEGGLSVAGGLPGMRDCSSSLNPEGPASASMDYSP